MLLFMTMLYIEIFLISISAMEINSINYEEINKISNKIYSKEYGVFLLISLISFGSLLFTGYLLV
jgi:hypothetical protein